MSFTYAIGDIHGSLDKLRTLIARCEQHADGEPMRFVFLGDYIDRGPQSREVVRYVKDLQARLSDRVVALMGNHEEVAVAVAEHVAPPDHWLSQGGVATLRSYRVARASELPAADLEWMRSLRLCYDDGRRFFVHAGIDPNRPLDAQDEHDLLWIREPFLLDGREHGRFIVHGHTPLTTGAPDLRANRVNLDTGAVFGGPLTAAVFAESRTAPVAFLQAH
jgi:serine/threonine protein phosphatase 1